MLVPSVFLFQLVAIVIVALCISGIPAAQQPFTLHLFIVILVLVVFVLFLVVVRVCIERRRNGAKNNYDVTDGKKGCVIGNSNVPPG